MPVYLHCSSNNQADTVLDMFREAVATYGLPSRIRIDKGGENVDVAMHLLTHPLHGPGRGTVIVNSIVKSYCTEKALRPKDYKIHLVLKLLKVCGKVTWETKCQ